MAAWSANEPRYASSSAEDARGDGGGKARTASAGARGRLLGAAQRGAVQPRLLDGDGGLLSEPGEPPHLALVALAGLRPEHADGAEHRVLADERHGEHGAAPMTERQVLQAHAGH